MANTRPKRKTTARKPRAKRAGVRAAKAHLSKRPGARTQKVNTRSSKTKNPHEGSSLDDFLRDEGVFEESTASAIKGTIAWQLAEAMKARGVSKTGMAEAMGTSRASLDRLLDPENESLTLSTLIRAAEILGLELDIGIRDRDSGA